MNEIDLQGNVLRLQNLQPKKEIRENVKPKGKQAVVKEQVHLESSKGDNANKSSEISETSPTEPNNAVIEENGVLEPFKVVFSVEHNFQKLTNVARGR